MVNARPHHQALKDIEWLLSDSQPDGVILDLVTRNTNTQLHGPSDTSSRVRLNWLVGQNRKEICANLLHLLPIRAKLIRIMDHF